MYLSKSLQINTMVFIILFINNMNKITLRVEYLYENLDQHYMDIDVDRKKLFNMNETEFLYYIFKNSHFRKSEFKNLIKLSITNYPNNIHLYHTIGKFEGKYYFNPQMNKDDMDIIRWYRIKHNYMQRGKFVKRYDI